MSPHPYRLGFGATPAPACRLIVTSGNLSESCDAVIDTGASWTSVPRHIISSLSLQKKGEGLRQAANSGAPEVVYRYKADLSFLGLNFPDHLFYGIDRPFALIGREILNRYISTFNGPPLNFTIEQ